MLTLCNTCRHTHCLIDKYNQNFTVRFQGYGNNPGLEHGINTISEFDREMRNSYKSITFDLVRKYSLLDVKCFFRGWLAYQGYGTSRKHSNDAVAQGGRDEEALHMHFFKNSQGNAVVQYKVYESEAMPYLPKQHPIEVRQSSTMIRVIRRQSELPSIITISGIYRRGI